MATFIVTLVHLFSQDTKGFLTHNFCSQQLINPTADLARLIYETESLVGIMASILVMAIALVISLLLLYWNQNIDSISSLIMYLGSRIQGSKQMGEEAKINVVQPLINNLSSRVDNIEKYGKWLYIPYVFFISLSIGIIVFLVGFRFVFDRQISAYISLVGVMVVILLLVALTVAIILIIPQAFGPEDKIQIQRNLLSIISSDLERKKEPQGNEREE